MGKNVIKMIKILILIQIGFLPLVGAGCNDEGTSTGPEDLKPNTSVSGEMGGGTEDPLKQLENEGKLPKVGTGGKMPVIGAPSAPSAEGLSLYPPNVDPDQDNIPSTPIAGHPEISVDNCPNVFNPGQEDDNHNGVGNVCEN